MSADPGFLHVDRRKTGFDSAIGQAIARARIGKAAQRERRRCAIRGARAHNLKNIDVTIPRNQLTVITGLSGSGKSSLAFDTIYAEGQRRYMETLSAYARQFLGSMERPDVDSIEGLSPAIAIQPKTGIFSPRSTVGTLTEIYDYLRLLYARAGQPTCIQCGRPVVAHTTEQIVDEVLSLPGPKRMVILAPIKPDGRDARERLAELARAGFTRVMIDREVEQLSEDVYAKANQAGAIHLIVDRLVARDGVQKRLADSIEIASRYGDGMVKVEVAGEDLHGVRRRNTRSRGQKIEQVQQLADPATVLRSRRRARPRNVLSSQRTAGARAALQQRARLAWIRRVAQWRSTRYGDAALHSRRQGRVCASVSAGAVRIERAGALTRA